MIVEHQPKIFGDSIRCGLTDSSDGNLRFTVDGSPADKDRVIENRKHVLGKLDMSFDSANLVYVTYDTANFCKYGDAANLELGQGMNGSYTTVSCDALVTTEPGRALFLPLADCVGAIMYDSVRMVLMVSHLGRHSTEQHGAARSIEYLKENYSCNPADLLVWLSPAAGKENYPLFAFNGRSLHDVTLEHLADAGVLKEKIEISSVDTTKDERYFSQSEFTAGRRQINGRFAIVAVIS